MNLNASFIRTGGETVRVEYQEGDEHSPLQNLEGKIFQGVHAFIIVKSSDVDKNGKMVLVNHPKIGWMPAGGGIEPGETYQEAVTREVKEETNMRVISQELIGFQDIYEPTRTVRQVRSFCIVEPYGDFVADPDGEIQEIKLIDPKEAKKYFDWGIVGDRLLERMFEMMDKNGITQA